eukprot:483444-Heterocapsa_arctica.AAC.1
MSQRRKAGSSLQTCDAPEHPPQTDPHTEDAEQEMDRLQLVDWRHTELEVTIHKWNIGNKEMKHN